MHSKVFLFILAVIFTSSFLANAQNKKAKSKPQIAKKTIECKSNDLSFPCLKGFKVVLTGDTDGFFLAKESKYNYGYSVFVVAPRETFTEQAVVPEFTKVFLKTLHPKESQEYRWKDSEYINNKPASKFEINKKLVQGFNGKQRVSIDYRRILHDNKDFIVGYLSELDRGKEAEELFNESLGGGSAPGCQDVVELIHSITKETDKDGESPCTIEVVKTIN